jgi:uncharacterized cupredoxin-like copper-binding protein
LSRLQLLKTPTGYIYAMNELSVGNIKIKATKAKDKKGREGFFITKEDWSTVRSAIVTKGAIGKTKKSLMPGMREALNEMREDLLGIKPLPNASEPIQGI